MIETEVPFRRVLQKLNRHTGFDFTGYKAESLMRRLSNRMRVMGITSYREYTRLLNLDEEEYYRLIDALTVNYTDWFRDEPVWEALRVLVLPQILQEKNKKAGETDRLQIVRAWSAACSTGEEAYSMAMLFRELLQRAKGKLHTSIFATDVDTLCLQKAKMGIYGKEEVQSLTPQLREKYFMEHEDSYTVSSELARLIRFKQHNLVQDDPLKYLDIVLCRNVMIYFNQELQQQLYKTLHGSLKTNGFLVLGRAERPIGEAAQLFTVVDLKQHIYRKV